MKPLLVFMMVTATLFAQSPAKQPSGRITGTVIDQNGSVVPSATVYAVPTGAVLDDVTPRSVNTDGNGRFDFHRGFDLGGYKLYSRKDADGYLNPLDAFYGDRQDKPVEVALTRKHPTASVTLMLDKQAAVISGKVFDVGSGTPLMAYVGLMDEDGNGHSMVVDGDYNLVVPAEKTFTLMVTVVGTRRPLVPVSSLRLEPGQHIYMDIPISKAED